MAPTEQIILYTAKVCPFAQRTEMALAEAKANFTRYEIDLKNKPEWYLTSINPLGKVPTIAFGGPQAPADHPSPESVKINESLVLVEFIADLFPKSSILPSDPVKRAKARLFIDAVSNKFIPAFFKVVHSDDADLDGLVAAAEHIQSFLPEDGFAIGEFSAADISIVPFLGRLRLNLENDLGGFQGGKGTGAAILELLSQPKLARFQKYWADVEARPSFVATFDKEFILPKFKEMFEALRAKKYSA